MKVGGKGVFKKFDCFIHPECYIFYSEGKNFIKNIASIILDY